jgi:hypothetical protein
MLFNRESRNIPASSNQQKQCNENDPCRLRIRVFRVHLVGEHQKIDKAEKAGNREDSADDKVFHTRHKAILQNQIDVLEYNTDQIENQIEKIKLKERRKRKRERTHTTRWFGVKRLSRHKPSVRTGLFHVPLDSKLRLGGIA